VNATPIEHEASPQGKTGATAGKTASSGWRKDQCSGESFGHAALGDDPPEVMYLD